MNRTSIHVYIERRKQKENKNKIDNKFKIKTKRKQLNKTITEKVFCR